MNEENEKNYKIREATKSFLNNQMKAEEYKQKLREEGINPEVDGISKYISQQQSGEPVNFSNMIRTIEVHKTDSITNPVQPKVRGLEEDGKNVNNKMMVPYKDK